MLEQTEHKDKYKDIVNRFGKFRITKDALFSDPFLIMLVMAKVAVVHAGTLHEACQDDVYEYVAISPEFRALTPGEKIPRYDVISKKYYGDNKVQTIDIMFKEVIANG